MALLDSFLGFLRGRRKNPRGDLLYSDQQRMEGYARYLRAYRGYSVRGPLATGTPTEARRLRFNFNRPIINLSAAFMAAKPLSWEVKGDPDAAAAAGAIWERSGSDLALLQAARTCSIYGEMGALATQDDLGPLIEFVDPWICFPVFDGADYSKLRSFEISYEREDAEGQKVLHREFYDQGTSEVFEGATEVSSGTHDRIPAAWIRNLSVTGVPNGISDLEGVIDLVEEYDHLAGKQTRIVDYYASPSIVFQGVSSGNVVKDVGTVYYLPSDGKAYFLEWSGTGPDVEKQLTRIRNAIAEISQVPAVAFGQQDGGITNLSGIAIQILYGPLLAKTRDKHANWTPALQYVMEVALRASGHKVAPGSVRCCWPDSMPVDGQEKVAQETDKTAAELSSRRTAMRNLGIEDPDAEFKRIQVEQYIVSAVSAAAGSTGPPDPVAVARAASKGHAAAEARAPGVQDVTPKGATQQDRVNARPAASGSVSASGAVGDPLALPPANPADAITSLLDMVDAALDAESASLLADAEEAEAGSD